MKDLRKLDRNSNIPKGMCIDHHFLSQFLSDLLVFYIAILQYSQRYVYRHFLSQLLSDLLVFTLLFCNHKKIFCCEMSVRDRQADSHRCTFLFGFRLLFISAKHDPESLLFSYEILAGDKPLFSQ